MKNKCNILLKLLKEIRIRCHFNNLFPPTNCVLYIQPNLTFKIYQIFFKKNGLSYIIFENTYENTFSSCYVSLMVRVHL